MSEDRPKKSWREIDNRRNQSAHRKDAATSQPRKSGAQKHQERSYRQALDRLFDTGRVSELVKAKSDDAKIEHARTTDNGTDNGAENANRMALLHRLELAEGTTAISEAVDAYVARFTLPDDPDVWAKVLDHRDPNRQIEAMQQLQRLLPTTQPKRSRALVGRLKYLRDVGDDPEITSLSQSLLDVL